MKVILYTTHCPKCKVLEAKLNKKNISYEEVSDINIIQEKGYLSVPILEVDDTSMNFATANTWINGLED